MADSPNVMTLAHILARRGAETPDRQAYLFLEHGEDVTDSRTDGQLFDRARAVAVRLAAEGVAPGDRVLLLFPPGLAFVDGFCGAQLAGAIPVPAYPPEPARLRRTLTRLRAIASDADVAVVLTSGALLDAAPAVLAHAPDLAALRWIAVDRLPADDIGSWQMPPIGPDDLAFLQYTSGSTGTPKGVMITHGNLVDNLGYIRAGFELGPDTVSVTWLPSIHDMGLIDGILGPLFGGYLGVVVPPVAFLKKPARWLQAISRYRGTHCGGPNFGYEYCTRRVPDADIVGLDLSQWKTAYNGAEPINRATLERFAERFRPTGFSLRAFFPCYGLAEGTLMVSGGPVHTEPTYAWVDAEALAADRVVERPANSPGTRALVSSGRFFGEMGVAIVDPQSGELCPIDRVGEIWIAGPSIARGYWNRAEVTAETFDARLPDGRGPYMRTGDLGFVRQRELFVTGRLKDLLIVRGRNLYPQDIEATVADLHPAARPGCAAAFGVEVGGAEQVVLVQEIDPRRIDDVDALLPAIRRAVAEQHDVHLAAVVLIGPRTIPKTTSGKIQRRATGVMFDGLELEVLAASVSMGLAPGARDRRPPGPLTDAALERDLTGWLSELCDRPAADLDPARPLGRQGLDLAGALELARRIERELGLAVPWTTLLGRPTAQTLAAALGEAAAVASAEQTPQPLDPVAFEAWLTAQVAELAGIDPRDIDRRQPFAELGLDSVGAVELSTLLEERLGWPVPDTLVWEHPDIAAVVAFAQARPDAAPPPVAAVDGRDIAIIGLGLRMPGADDPDAFWQLIHDCRDAISEVPPDRWSPEALAAGLEGAIDPGLLRWGGFIDDVDRFAAPFFGISAREAERIDPQHRLLLEVAWETLEHAHLSPPALRGSRTGVFVGVCSGDYTGLQFRAPAQLDIHVATGNARSVAANRLSYVFDLRGPSMAVDTACSSSLVAIHEAVTNLQRGACDLALAGGVNLILTPEMTIALGRAGMLSPDGRCKTLDAQADGYVRGEGCGLVALARLEDARRDGHRIIAVIKGSAVNHGGRTNGLTAPSHEGQVNVIREALDAGGVDGADVGLVELHGTGTALGDPIEARALAAALGTARTRPCAVTSLKANVGHLEAAAGIAGLIKVALALHHSTLPPHRAPSSINPRIDCAALGIEPLRTARPWPRSTDRARLAGVSSFGFGGANAHVVLGEAPPAPAPSAAVERPVHILCLSARTDAELDARIGRTVETLASGVALADLCYTVNARRAHHRKRLAVVGQSSADVLTALRENGEAINRRAVPRGAPRVVFQFTGQGSQLPSMGRRLYETQPTFRAAFDACDRGLRPLIGESIIELVAAVGQRIHQTEHAQPALFALQWSLAAMWRAWGIEPSAAVGHSAGEIAAACIAGAIDFEDGLRLVAERARLMQSAPANGAMVMCRGDRDAVVRELARHRGAVVIAAYNSPENTIISGPHDPVLDISRALVAAGLTCRELTVSHAFHSAEMDGILDAFEAFASGIETRAPALPLYSSVLGRRLEADERLDGDYWRRHIRQPVRYADAVTAAGESGYEIFLELGPRPVLTALGRATVGHRHPSTIWLPSLSSSGQGWPMALESLGQLYLHGVDVDWAGFDRDYPRRPVELPGYPFSRERYWSAPAATAPATAPGGRISAPPAPTAPPIDSAGVDGIVALFRQQNDVLQRLAASWPAAAGLPATAPARAVRAPIPAAPSGPPPTAPRRPSREAVLTQVRGHVAAVSGFSLDQLAGSDHLATELGLDSLMLTELTRRLRASYPDADLDPETLGNDPTIDFVARQIVGATAAPAPVRPPQLSAPPAAVAMPPPRTDHPDDWRFENWPEVREIQERLAGGVGDEDNPYGRVHFGMNAGTAVVNEIETVNFASFNYLGLSADPQVCAAARRAIDRYGTSASATPLLLGETPLHHELEAEIADFLGTEAAIVFASGHQTNVATLGHLVGPEDLVIHDQYIHDSSVRGAMLAGATRRSFPHNDAAALDRLLGRIRDRHRRVIICLEGAYSQDGDLCDLPAFIEVKKRHRAMLMIDEAHSIGVLGATGAGIGEHWGVDRDDVDLWMGTLSKALGSCGGYIAAREPIIRFMKFTTPLFIFSTGISPANTAAALEAIRVCRARPELAARVRLLATKFRTMAQARGLDTGIADGSAIVPIIIGSWQRSIALSNRLLERGINVMPIGYPAVAKDAARLRFFLCADHDEAQLQRALDALVEVIAELDMPARGHSGARHNGAHHNGAHHNGAHHNGAGLVERVKRAIDVNAGLGLVRDRLRRRLNR